MSKQLEKLIQTEGLEGLGVFYGKYRGFVVDRNDPLHAGRLKLQCPQVWGENVTNDVWAWSFGIYAGKDTGFYFLPEVGEVVWVEFERGDPSAPIWTYGHWAKEETNSISENYTDKILQSPDGYRIAIKESSAELEIEHKNGTKIVLNNTAASIVRNGLKISLGGLNTSAQPAVLGTNNENALKGIVLDITNALNQVLTLIAALVTESGANAALFPPFAPTAAAFATAAGGVSGAISTIITNLAVLDAVTIPATKSVNTTLD